MFLGTGERIEITHRAASCATVRARRFGPARSVSAGKTSGLYDMQDARAALKNPIPAASLRAKARSAAPHQLVRFPVLAGVKRLRAVVCEARAFAQA